LEVVTILKAWKGSSNLNDIAPTIYIKWIYLYLKGTFGDELGKEGFKQFLKTHLMKQVIAKQITNDNSLWWDNIETQNKKETRKEILSQSFKEAVATLEKQLGNSVQDWTWNKVHVVEYEHPLGKVAALRKIFNVGPFEVAGSNEVINNQMFDYSNDGDYVVNGGPSTRRIVDFSDVENSWSILPTGQSGNPFSAHYNDQAVMYNEGKFRKMKMNKKEIVKTSTKLIFTPSKN
jgi:penicillin amidase